MAGTKDKRQEPGKGREEQNRPQRPGQDPVHPERDVPSRGNPARGGQRPEEMERRREDDLLRDERNDF
ncbi:hypothetical protein ACFWCB_30820 [Streptomyces sp. NPDC060048]|uniref:hypothetical protein n=1 Tax=unclassified Streptomyces TaxID=2593676 RepID=UPI003674D584